MLRFFSNEMKVNICLWTRWSELLAAWSYIGALHLDLRTVVAGAVDFLAGAPVVVAGLLLKAVVDGVDIALAAATADEDAAVLVDAAVHFQFVGG